MQKFTHALIVMLIPFRMFAGFLTCNLPNLNLTGMQSVQRKTGSYPSERKLSASVLTCQSDLLYIGIDDPRWGLQNCTPCVYRSTLFYLVFTIALTLVGPWSYGGGTLRVAYAGGGEGEGQYFLC